VTSRGAVASGFAEWLAAHQSKGQFTAYDADAEFARLADRLAAGERMPAVEA